MSYTTTPTKPDYPTTNGGRMLRRGDTFDIEDARTTHRLRIGQGILRSLGLESTVTHSAQCAERKLIPVGMTNFWRGCDDRCVTSWPEYATGAMFDLAYRLADEFQTERGNYNRGDR